MYEIAKIIPFPVKGKQKLNIEGEQYTEFKTNGVLKARPMESIQSYDEFKAMQNYLESRNIRDWMMWTIGVCFGFRISDLLSLRFRDVLNDDNTFRDKLTIWEDKTDKLNDFPLTEAIKHALRRYLDSINWQFNPNDWIFISQKNCRLRPQSAWRILSNAGKEVVPHLTIGAHSMRKTHACIMLCLLKTQIDVNSLTAVQMALNHTDFRTTMRYLGIMTKILNKGRQLVSDFVLGESGVSELTIGTTNTIDDVMDTIKRMEELLTSND